MRMKELHDCIFHLFKVSSHDAAKFGKNLYNRSSDINLGPHRDQIGQLPQRLNYW